MEPKFCSINDWVRLTGMSRRVTYQRLTDGDLRAKKVGSKTLIDAEHGFRYLRGLPDARFNSPQRRAKSQQQVAQVAVL